MTFSIEFDHYCYGITDSISEINAKILEIEHGKQLPQSVKTKLVECLKEIAEDLRRKIQ